MTNLRKNAPRRYFVDAAGRRVLIGLTLEETFEFEQLDNLPPSHANSSCEESGLWSSADEQRWLVLYAKHDGAWKVWIAQSRVRQAEAFSLY